MFTSRYFFSKPTTSLLELSTIVVSTHSLLKEDFSRLNTLCRQLKYLITAFFYLLERYLRRWPQSQGRCCPRCPQKDHLSFDGSWKYWKMLWSN